MNNYYQQSVYDKVSKSLGHLYIAERYQKDNFAFIANSNFGQSIPMDFTSKEKIAEMIERGYPIDKITFSSPSVALNRLKEVYDNSVEVRKQSVKAAVPFMVEFLKDKNNVLLHNSLFQENFSKNTDLFMLNIRNQKNHIEKTVKSLKKEKIAVPIGYFKKYMLSIGAVNGLTIPQALKFIDSNNLCLNPNKDLIQWVKLIKEHRFIEGEKSSNNSYKLRESLQNCEDAIKASSKENSDLYESYTTLPPKFDLNTSIKSFIQNYSVKNIISTSNVDSIFVDEYVNSSFKGLKVIDSIHLNNFFNTHFKVKNFTESFMSFFESCCDKFSEKDYKDNKEAFFQDVRKVSHLFSHYSKSLDYLSSSGLNNSSSIDEEALEAGYDLASKMIENNKEYLSSSKDIGSFIEAICQGTESVNHSNTNIQQCWAEAIKSHLNDGKKSVMSSLLGKETFGDDVSVQEKLFDDFDGYGYGSFDEVAIPVIQKVYSRFWGLNATEKNKFLKLTGNPGILKTLKSRFVSLQLNSSNIEINESNILENIYIREKFSVSDNIKNISSILGTVSSGALSKDKDSSAFINEVFFYMGKELSELSLNEVDVKIIQKMLPCSMDKLIDLEPEKPFLIRKKENTDYWMGKSIFYTPVCKNFEEDKKSFFEFFATAARGNDERNFRLHLSSPEAFLMIGKIQAHTECVNTLNHFSLSYNMENKNPVTETNKIFDFFEKNPNHLNLGEYCKNFQSLEFVFNDENIIDTLKEISKTESHNAFGVLRYKLLKRGEGVSFINNLSFLKENPSMMASAICWIDKKRGQGDFSSEATYGFNMSSFMPQFKIEDEEFLKVANSYFKSTQAPDITNYELWDIHNTKDTFFSIFLNSVNSSQKLLGDISSSVIDEIESIGNKSCVDIASNSLELITAIIADNSNFMKDNPQAILDIANEIYKENLLDNTNIVDAFDDAVKIASNSLNNVQGNNIQMNLEDIKNAVLLNKKLNSVMSNASDASSEISTKNSFKL